MIDEIESIGNSENIGLGYVYFDYKSHDEQSEIKVLSSLLRQLVSQKDAAIAAIIAMYQQFFNSEDRPGVDSILEGVTLVSGYFSSTFIVLDALDEFATSQRSSLLDKLGHILNSRTSIKLFAASRPHLKEVDDFFEDSVRIEIRAHIDDIKNYLRKKLEGKVARRGLQNIIIDKVSSSTKGL